MNTRGSLLLAIVLCTTAGAHADLVATLQVLPDTTLPGVPVSFAVALSNTGNAVERLTGSVQLEVQPQSGAAFIPEWGRGEASAGVPMELLNADDEFVVPPSETKSLYLPMDLTLIQPEFFFDPRLNAPAHLRVRAILDRPPAKDGQRRAIYTDWKALRITTPAGPDLEVWQLMSAGGAWTSEMWGTRGFEIASTIVERYRGSGYYPYALMLALPTDEVLEGIETSIARHPNDAITEYLRFRQAAIHGSRGKAAFTDGRLDLAVKETSAAHELLAKLIRDTPNGFIRHQAERYRQSLDDPKEMRGRYKYLEETAAPAPERLRPFVQCADRVDDVIVARFGYENRNAGGKRVAAGDTNFLSPGPADQGQPGFFAPGLHLNAAGVIARNRQPPSWTLDGTTVVVQHDSSPCGPETRRPVRPIPECVRADNEGVIIRFGYENANAFPVAIPLGQRNDLDENARDAPPQTFLPGRVHDAFRIKVKEGSVTWTLDGATATAGRSDAPLCE